MVDNINTIPHDSSMTLDLLEGQLRLTRNYLLKEIEGITPQELDYSPDLTRIETIGTMLFHIADVENSWIFEHLDGQEVDFETWKWAFPLRLDLDPVQRTGMKPKFYLDTLKKVRNAVLEYLVQFDDGNRSQVFTSKMGKTTLEWTLFHIHRHEQHHIGQINLLRRMYGINSEK